MFLTKFACDKIDLQHTDCWDVCEMMNRKSERCEEGIGHGLIYRHLPGKTEDNHDYFGGNSRDLNPGSPEFEDENR